MLEEQPRETLTRTTLGLLSGGEHIVLELLGRELWLSIGGVQIARRGHRGSRQVRDWKPVHRGWRVRDTDGPKIIHILHNGVEVEWAIMVPQLPPPAVPHRPHSEVYVISPGGQYRTVTIV